MKKLLKKFLQFIGLDVQKVNRAPVVEFENEPDFNNLYDFAQEKTQMKYSDNIYRRQRHFTLQRLLNITDINNGAVAECGSFRGLSAFQISTILKKRNFGQSFYIFDSFEGLSDFKDEDKQKYKKIDYKKRQDEFSCDIDTVKSNLSDFSFIKYYKGWIPDRFKEVENQNFSFVHIDVDMYEPIKDCISFFYPRLEKGGFMVFDDYGFLGFPGAKKAIDEFFEKRDDVFLSLPSGQAFVIKK